MNKNFCRKISVFTNSISYALTFNQSINLLNSPLFLTSPLSKANPTPFRILTCVPNQSVAFSDRYYRSESRGGFRNGFVDDYRAPSPPLLTTTTIPVQTTHESFSRSKSRSSRREWSEGPDGFFRSEVRSSSRGPGEFRSLSRGPDGYRSEYRSGGENLLSPEREFDRSASRASQRSVRIHREERY
jgi:hypothetical protein